MNNIKTRESDIVDYALDSAAINMADYALAVHCWKCLQRSIFR